MSALGAALAGLGMIVGSVVTKRSSLRGLAFTPEQHLRLMDDSLASHQRFVDLFERERGLRRQGVITRTRGCRFMILAMGNANRSFGRASAQSQGAKPGMVSRRLVKAEERTLMMEKAFVSECIRRK